jgi:DNA-directed RNA polymerase specialized sigma24 family protein
MERTRLAKASLAELKKSIRVAKGRKEELKNYIDHLHQAHSQGKISSSQYLETLHKKHDKRNLQEHVHYYDNFIKEHENKIRKHTHSSRSFGFFIIVLILALSLLAYFYLEPTITGFFGQTKIQEKEFAQSLNLNFNSSTTYELQLENQGQLNYIKLDGLIKGQGSVKVYIDNILILDSSNIKQKASSPSLITGASILNSEEVNGAPQDTSNETSPFPDQDENLGTSDQKSGTEEPPASEILNETNEPADLKNTSQNETTNETTTEETTAPEKTTKEEEIVPQEIVKEFSGICEKTCNLTDLNLNKTSYTLRIEIGNAELFLDTIKYSITEKKPKENITDVNATISEENITTIQGEAVLGQPVKWKKTFSVQNPEKIKINLPKEATNIITKERDTDKIETSDLQDISQSEIELTIDAQAKDYEIEYETPAPLATEEQISQGKRVKISSPDNIHYENVLAFTNLPENLNIKNPSRVKIHWIEQDTYLSPTSIQDKDNNGIYDYIEWIAPSLSNQTFDIIVIIKAEHLDSNREFISDIYDQVYQQDDIWSEEIPNQDYVRITFEIPLNNSRDITLYPRITSGNPRIEVYEFNQTTKIAEFTNLIDNEYNKILLTNLVGEQDTFDLKIQGGSVEFDHIIDPNYIYVMTTSAGPNYAYWAQPTSSLRWTTGTQASAAQYTNLSSDNGQYARVDATSANDEPFWRFNFSINETADRITSINVSFNGYENGTNAATAFVWNYTSGAWLTVGTVPTSDGVISALYTSGFSSIIGPTNKHLVMLVEGSNFGVPDYIWADYPSVNVTTESTPPKWFNNQTNSTLAGKSVLHSVNWTDNVNLSGYIFSFDNGTGTFTNDSWVNWIGLSNWSNVTKVVNYTTGVTIQWMIYANDSSGNQNVTSTFSYVTTTDSPPKWYTPSTNDTSPHPNDVVLHNVNWTDETSLSYAILEVNSSGASCNTLANVTTNSSFAGTTNWSNMSWQVPNACEGKTIGWKQYSNDSLNQWNATSLQTYTVQNVAPTITLPVYTNATKYSNTQSLTFNISVVDTGVGADDCAINVNGNANQTVAVSSGWCNGTYALTGIADGNKTIRAYANDTAGNLALNDSYVVFVDSTAPTVTLPVYTNATIKKSSDSLFINISVSDSGTGPSYCAINVGTATAGNVTVAVSSGWCNTSYSLAGSTDGNKTISAYANDTAGNLALNNSYVVFIDSTAPTITLPVYTNATKYSNTQSLTFNISVVDTGVGADDCAINVNGNANQTVAVSSGWCNGTYALTGIADGNKTIRAYANDTAGNLALNNSYVVWIDSTAPTITLPVYTNLTAKRSSDSLFINVSVSDSGVGASYCTINVATATGGNVTVAVSSGWCNTTYALAGSTEGNQIINAYANDTLGNAALNNSYSVKIDNTAPTVTLPVYTNATQKQNTDTLTLNISVSDSGSGTTGTVCLVDVTGTNQSIAYSNGWCNSSSISLAGLSDGNKIIKVYANDSANNFGLNDSFVVDIISQVAPTIQTVETITAKNPTDDTITSITFNFTATDSNGASDINTNTAQAYFQRGGETTRSNTSCINTSIGVGNDINFTCTIDMWYFDQNGAWTINVSIKDNSAAYGENSSTNFVYNLLPGMKMSPTSLTWQEILIGQANTGSNNDPIQINNTGNDIDVNINITSYHLRGEITTSEYIYANNFTIENESQGCSGTAMSNATSTNITSAILQRGNHSLNYNNATSGQEQMYFCLKGLPSGISQQPYSSTAYGSWEIRILLTLAIPRLRKKKKSVKDDKLVKALDLILDELKEEYSLNKKEIAEVMMSKLKEKYNLSKKEILNTIKSSEETKIPVTIFSKDIGALESLVKYMKENLNMSYSKISKLLSRNERTIWTAYSKAKEKQKEALKIKDTEIHIPIEIFKDKKLTILESAIVYLKEKGLKFSEISNVLSRDQRNIWTIHARASKKLNKNI